MKALLAVLIVALAPAHIRFAVAGVPVSVSAAWLILAAEVLAAVVTAWLAVRVIRRFRSAPWHAAGRRRCLVSAAAAGLGPRQAAILAHLEEHPGRTATELARAFGLRASLFPQLAALEQKALVVGRQVWNPGQGRQVTRWHVAPPGTVPPPRPAPDPVDVSRRRERDTAAQRARRARRNPPRRPALPAAPPALADAACKGADTGSVLRPGCGVRDRPPAARGGGQGHLRRVPGPAGRAWPTRWTPARPTASGAAERGRAPGHPAPPAEGVVSAAEARTWVTEIGTPAADGALRMHSPHARARAAPRP